MSRGGVLLTVGLLFAAGCNLAGPASLRSGRVQYNVAIQQSGNEQILLNLVRLRYMDMPYFIEVAGIPASLELSAQLSGTLTQPRSPDSPYLLGGQVSAREQPTITYAPLVGEKFALQLMTPMGPNTLLLLHHSGWSIKRVLLCTVQSINGVENAPFGPTPAQARDYQPFREAMNMLAALEDRGSLLLGMAPHAQGKPVLELRIAENATDSPEARRLREILRLDARLSRFPVTMEAGPGGDHIDIVPSSLIGCFFYLSRSVETPAHDEKAERVAITRNQDGSRCDWKPILGNLLQVHQPVLCPLDPYVAVWYRDRWFYISNNDDQSKATFVMLSQLFALSAGDIRSAVPVLTLPVAR